MKEAAGEANMTVMTIILIGVVLAAGYGLVNTLMDKVKNRSDKMEQTDQTGYVVEYNNYL